MREFFFRVKIWYDSVDGQKKKGEENRYGGRKYSFWNTKKAALRSSE